MSTIGFSIYTVLMEEVGNQTPSERKKTIRSSGLPHYRLPKGMDSKQGPCCPKNKPCMVHRLYNT
jgi:hypothetical protein